MLLAALLACTTPEPPPPPLAERDEPAQLAALEDALLSDPEQALALCAQVTAPAARDRCARLRKRPHLWQPRPAARDLPSPHAGAAPLEKPCGGHPQPRACWSRFAYGKAASGDVATAASACAAIDEARWREECWFQAGEAAVERRLAAGYADGLSLCAIAGRFQRDCLAHATSLLAEAAPADPSGDWAATIGSADAITAAWEGIDPEEGTQWRDRMWAEALLYAYDRAESLNGAPLDALPADALPHVRAAVAWRLLALQPPDRQDLAAWEVTLGDALASRKPAQRSQRPRRALTSIPDLSPPDASEAGVIHWIGVSRRRSSPDPVIDRRLCLLEAAARRPNGRGLVEAAASDPEPLVQQASQRLLAALDSAPVH